MTQRSRPGTFTSQDGEIGVRSRDGTALPLLRSAIRNTLMEIADLPSVQKLPPLRLALERALYSDHTLNDADIHLLWRVAHHRDFPGKLGHALAVTANIHRAANEMDRNAEGERARAGGTSGRSPAQLEKDIARITHSKLGEWDVTTVGFGGGGGGGGRGHDDSYTGGTEPMWKLSMTDDKGHFETWEMGDTAKKAVYIAKVRRGTSAKNIRNVRDAKGKPIMEMAPRHGPKRDAWNLQHLAQIED